MDLTCSPRQLGTRSLLKTAPQRQDPVNGILAVVGAKRTATVPVWGLHKFGTESNHPPRASSAGLSSKEARAATSGVAGA
jgi:hypothetical protein